MKAEKKQKEYFVSHLGQHMGPWSLDEIAHRMSELQLIATDFIYDEDAADWIELNRHEGLLELISREFKPKSAPPKLAAKQQQERGPARSQESSQRQELAQHQEQAPIIQVSPTIIQESRPSAQAPQIIHASQATQPAAEQSVNESWFIQKKDHRFGPLSSLGVVKALQEKTIFDFEFIWKDGMNEWIRIAEHPEFSVESIRELLSHPKVSPIFIKREFPRITFMNEVMVHDNNSLWMGQAFQGGEGGSGLIIQNAGLQPGQVVKLHFATHDGLGAFNVAGEIVSKKFVKELKNKKTPVPYGVKFVGLDKKLQNTLHEYFTYKTQPGWMFAGK